MSRLMHLTLLLLLSLIIWNATATGQENDLRQSWNDQHCQIEGCKPASEALWKQLSLINKTREELAFRNSLWDPLYHDFAPFNNRTANTTTRTANTTRRDDNDSTLVRPSSLQYLGIMVDAGRHYFTIKWLYRLLDLMALMNYNLLHLRLTDDQAFRVQLESLPTITNATLDTATTTIYSVAELKSLVRYADTLGIIIMPEVTVPSHAGGWTRLGMTNMIVPCPERMCRVGFSLPLNLRNSNMTRYVKTVLREIVQIFDTSPYLHLGGNDVHLSAACLEEVNYVTFPQHYQRFQTVILDFVQNTLHKQVVQWQSALPTFPFMKDDPLSPMEEGIANVNRFNEDVIRHYKTSHDFRLPPNENRNIQSFCSDQQFNFDTHRDLGGFDAYASIRTMVQTKHPLAVICDTQEMGMSQWLDRNVIGKMLAVSMGASSLAGQQNLQAPTHFSKRYDALCRDTLRFDERLCALRGRPPISKLLYSSEWQAMDMESTDQLCERLTTGKKKATRQFKLNNQRKKRLTDVAKKHFWDQLGEIPEFASSTLQPVQYAPYYDSLQQYIRGGTTAPSSRDDIRHTGLILDLVRIDDDMGLSRILSTLDLMNGLGLNTLQLRIMSDFGFAVEVPQYHDLQWGRNYSYFYSEQHVERIVSYAARLGIQVIPEIAMVTSGGGGWFAAGLLVDCPNQAEEGTIAADATNNDLLVILVSVLRQLVEQFHHPPYIHLGFDEPEEVQACFMEARRMIDLNDFERRLKKTLDFQGFDDLKLIRWDNSRGAVYPLRAEGIPQRHPMPKLAADGNKTTKLVISSLDLVNVNVDAWGVYQQTRKLAEQNPLGILASVELVRASFWNHFAVTQRLVAFAMGFTRNSMSKSEFDTDLQKALSTLNVTSNAEGRIANATSARHSMQQDLKSRKKRACDERTVIIKKILPKVGVLV